MPICSSAFHILSCSSFTVSGLTLRSLIHLELMLIQGKTQVSSFSLLHVVIQFLQHHLLKRLSFLQCMFCVSLSKIRLPPFNFFLDST
jgi:hypothetical protein